MLSKDFAIRRALLTDVEKIAHYNILLASETEDKKLDRELVLKGVNALIEDPDKGFYLIAEKGDGKDGIVGQLMITFEWSDWRNKCFWWIQSVYVEKKFRNKRVFTCLFNEILRLARLSGDVCGFRLYVEENNELAKKVYEAIGMKRARFELYDLAL